MEKIVIFEQETTENFNFWIKDCHFLSKKMSKVQIFRCKIVNFERKKVE
uniref:Uncharacterized protein n=1 Tax=Romanomermis culicivorax TaxID=13658 RepID=A0A915JWJ2_ROMCU